MKIMMMVWACDYDQAIGLGKKKEKNKMGSKVISIEPFYFR
jgi:hypothetical protein